MPQKIRTLHGLTTPVPARLPFRHRQEGRFQATVPRGILASTMYRPPKTLRLAS